VQRSARHGSMAERLGLGLGALGLLALLVGYFLGVPGVAQSYLYGYSFFLALTLGTLSVLLLHHLLKSHWGQGLQPFLEASVLTLPYLGVLFLPILATLPELYPWAQPEKVAADPLLKHREVYNNPLFYTVRMAAYFLFWTFVAGRLVGWGRTANPTLVQKRTETAAWGLALFVVVTTFGAFDLLMGLEPHFYSASYGALFAVGHTLGGLAFAAMLATRTPAVAAFLARKNLQNQANLMLAFSIIWIYLALTTFIIVWGADLPHEVEYYVPRSEGLWGGVAAALLLGQFLLPFLALLTNPPKRDPRVLFYVALWIVAFRLVDHTWTVIPSFGRGLLWTDLAALLGVGGLWMVAFTQQLRRRLDAVDGR
jgi:hypothetical protein